MPSNAYVQSFPSKIRLEPVPRFVVHVMVSSGCGAENLTTCIVEAAPGARLPYHTHPTGEAIVVLDGEALADVEGRRYRLKRWDALFVPAGVAHSMVSAADDRPVLLGTAFPTSQVTREFVADRFSILELDQPRAGDPESLVRWTRAVPYSLAPAMSSRNLFAGSLGAAGICGGIAEFLPGAELPCHRHDFDESITILSGEAVSHVAGTSYRLSQKATIHVPRGTPHRFLNEGSEPMVMFWVYASDEPTRTLVAPSLCDEQPRITG
jgi:putative monooxygenase